MGTEGINFQWSHIFVGSGELLAGEIGASACVCVCVCVSVCMYVCICRCTCMYVCMCICVCMSVCIRVCAYVYMCESSRVRETHEQRVGICVCAKCVVHVYKHLCVNTWRWCECVYDGFECACVCVCVYARERMRTWEACGLSPLDAGYSVGRVYTSLSGHTCTRTEAGSSLCGRLAGIRVALWLIREGDEPTTSYIETDTHTDRQMDN